MIRKPSRRRRAFTLLEITLVLGILVIITAMVMPSLFKEFTREELPGSGRQLRSLLTLVSANASFDGKRYRVRFPDAESDETDALGGDRQPLIEREDDPFNDPEVFNLVTAPWAVGNTLLNNVRCAEVRLGRPTIERLRDRRNSIADAIAAEFEDFDPQLPPLIFDPDGTSDWATFVLVRNAPKGIALEELVNYERIEVIYEGATGLAWLQRPFYDEELDLFEENNWPAVLRQDFFDPRVLTEDDVLELRDVPTGSSSAGAEEPDGAAAGEGTPGPPG